MSKLHRELFDRLGPGPVPAVLLDTPFGFQENADDISAKALAYFRESVNRDVAVASFRSAAEIGSLDHETTLTRLREARWVFSGPGSPSYALSQWRPSQVPALLSDKLRAGGCVVFASAAATTLGRFALPVYEIYKVGQPPSWLEGLNILEEFGLPAVVIPHYNNAEGGHHDTRFCYMGERRLTLLESFLPDDVFVLGVDEHTACTIDIAAGTVSVTGLGGVTVRRRGRSRRVEAGETMSVGCLVRLANEPAVVSGAPALANAVEQEPEPRQGDGALARSPLLDEVAQMEATFAEALAARDARGAVTCMLSLDDLLVAWSRDTLQSDELPRARAALRSMIVRLGEAAEAGVRDPRQAVAPFVEGLLDARQRARADRRWDDADHIRDRLVAGGVEVRDSPTGTEWELS